uniref:Uncharacterized protein n=1 Tax=Acrobeloides nanus TaxID=290746 RepID=A0A914EKW4_9BILA
MDTTNTSSYLSHSDRTTGFCTNSSQFIHEPMTKRPRTLCQDMFEPEHIAKDDSNDERRRKRIVKTFETARQNGIIGVSELCERLMVDTNLWLVEVIDARPRIYEGNFNDEECDRLLNAGHVILVKLNVSIANGIANEVKDTFLDLALDVELSLNDLQSAKKDLHVGTWDTPMEEGV